MRLHYQPQNEQEFDITALATHITLTTHRVGRPATLEVTLLGGGAIPWIEGSRVGLWGEAGLFCGYLFRITDSPPKVTLLA